MIMRSEEDETRRERTPSEDDDFIDSNKNKNKNSSLPAAVVVVVPMEERTPALHIHFLHDNHDCNCKREQSNEFECGCECDAAVRIDKRRDPNRRPTCWKNSLRSRITSRNMNMNMNMNMTIVAILLLLHAAIPLQSIHAFMHPHQPARSRSRSIVRKNKAPFIDIPNSNIHTNIHTNIHIPFSLLTASMTTNANTNTNSIANANAKPMEPAELIPKLKSYATNIRRTRHHIQVQKPKPKPKPTRDEQHISTSSSSSSSSSTAAIRSLLYTLQHETIALAKQQQQQQQQQQQKHSSTVVLCRTLGEGIKDAFNHALIQAIRASSAQGDYIMIRNIVDRAVEYSIAFAGVYHYDSVVDADIVDVVDATVKLLEARVFGEAIVELEKTTAGDSKLKKVWAMLMELGAHCESIGGDASDAGGMCVLASKPSAYELNAMIGALGRRGKVRSALKIYQEVVNGVRSNSNSGSGLETCTDSVRIVGDEYTASAVLIMLAKSIEEDDVPTRTSSSSDVGVGVGVLEASSSSSGGKGKATVTGRGAKSVKLTSPCWQWNEAISILNDFEKRTELNNQVYAAALKVNEQAMDLYRFPGDKHPGAKYAMSVLERMQKRGVSPDVVTCSLVMSTFDKGKQWKAALALLQGMENAQNGSDSSDRASRWVLPAPNVYTYASVISSCARGGQYDEAIRLLDEIRSKTSDTEGGGENAEGTNEEIGVRPNSWIYNSALAACVPPMGEVMGEVGIKAERRFDTAIQILHRMENDAKMGFDTLPDAVTYNTLLSTVRGIEKDEKLDDKVLNAIALILDVDGPTSIHEQVVVRILETMREKGIPKDAGTYRNAISACYMHPESAERILDMALEDSDMLERVQYEGQSEFDYKENNILYLINAALTVCGNGGNMEVFARVINRMKNFDILADSKSMLSLVRGLSSSGNCEDSMIALNAMKGDGAANEQLVEKYDINIIEAGFNAVVPMIKEQHYSTAIAGCLRDGQLFPALKILNAMKIHDLKPNASSLQGIILAYCKLATDEASTEFKEARKEYSKGKARGPFFRADHTISRTRASAALAMMNTINEIPIKLKCVVASACAATGMWVEAREILWSLHIAAVLEKKREKYVEITDSDQGSALAELPKLHRSLLKLCARSGNVTAALWFVDTIQDLKCKFDDGSYSIDERPSTKFSIGNETEILNSWDVDEPSVTSQKYGIGMTGESWQLLMIAASKSAHWKVCLGTLAFIQPFIEATNPANASTEEGKGPTMKSLNREYEKLSRALTAAVLALEIRGQYAWALRAIDDWIEWSGRRPAKEAIFSACRILAARGIGSEVVALVNKVINIQGRRRRNKILTYDTSYEMALYTEAITALHNRGLYESADELYVNAISKGFLPFSIMVQSPKSEFKVDLHGMNRAIAHSAVRVSLQHFVQSKNKGKLERDVLIVTGKGSNSQKHLRPVLRPAVQRMLVEEFYPPISTTSLPNNMGALRISVDDANAWIEHQEDQKGARFLAVADLLKTFTTGARLKTLLSRNIKRFPTPKDESSK